MDFRKTTLNTVIIKWISQLQASYVIITLHKIGVYIFGHVDTDYFDDFTIIMSHT